MWNVFVSLNASVASSCQYTMYHIHMYVHVYRSHNVQLYRHCCMQNWLHFLLFLVVLRKLVNCRLHRNAFEINTNIMILWYLQLKRSIIYQSQSPTDVNMFPLFSIHEPLIHFIGKTERIVFHTEISNRLQLISIKNLHKIKFTWKWIISKVLMIYCFIIHFLSLYGS